MKPLRTRLALIAVLAAIVLPTFVGCAAAVSADPAVIAAPSTAFDVQAGTASDNAGIFVATLLAGVMVAVFLAGIGAAYSAWTD